MHILYFHQHFTTRKGAGGLRSYEFARRLIQRGHAVTLVCGINLRGMSSSANEAPGTLRESEIDGIRVIEISLPYSNHDSLARRTMTFVRYAIAGIGIAMRRHYDLVFATSTPLTAGIPGILAKTFRRKPFIFEVRDLWPELPKAMGVIRNPLVLAMMSLLEWTSYRASDGCVALAPGIAEGIRKRAPKDHPVTVVPNACDNDLFDIDTSRSDAWPGYDPEDLLCVFAGAHGRANGLDAALDAAHELLQRGEQHIRLVFVGDGREKSRLQERVRAENLTNCEFHDLVPKERLAELLIAADVGMQLLANVPAFYYGTSPNKFFDYLAAGLPVLNNYPGWLAEIISENDCGVAVKPDDPGAFADALVFLRDQPERRRQMGVNARKLARERFSRDRLGKKFCDFLEDVKPGDSRLNEVA